MFSCLDLALQAHSYEIGQNCKMKRHGYTKIDSFQMKGVRCAKEEEEDEQANQD